MLQLKHDDQWKGRSADQHGDPNRNLYPEARGLVLFLQASPIVFDPAGCKALYDCEKYEEGTTKGGHVIEPPNRI